MSTTTCTQPNCKRTCSTDPSGNCRACGAPTNAEPNPAPPKAAKAAKAAKK